MGGKYRLTKENYYMLNSLAYKANKHQGLILIYVPEENNQWRVLRYWSAQGKTFDEVLTDDEAQKEFEIVCKDKKFDCAVKPVEEFYSKILPAITE